MNGYVPWDVSYLNEFFKRILQAIGSSTNVGIIIFGIVLGILVVIMIIKRFTR